MSPLSEAALLKDFKTYHTFELVTIVNMSTFN